MATPVHEFVCADCKADVFSYGSPDPTSTRCASCELIIEMRTERGLSAKAEADLREMLGCTIPTGDVPGGA